MVSVRFVMDGLPPTADHEVWQHDFLPTLTSSGRVVLSVRYDIDVKAAVDACSFVRGPLSKRCS